jgi:hypothetical protein
MLTYMSDKDDEEHGDDRTTAGEVFPGFMAAALDSLQPLFQRRRRARSARCSLI